MNIEVTEKNIEKEYRYGDQSVDALNLQIILYFEKDYRFEVKREGDYVILNDIKKNKKFNLRGDNLITKKKMFIKMFGRKKYLNEQIENDNHIYSYILMPHIPNIARCQINSKRASVQEYSDNPFIFFSSLEALYRSKFEKEDADPVEIWIIKNRSFWDLFGEGEDGYNNYLDTFCLEGIKEIMKSSKSSYEKFFKKQTIPKETDRNDWNKYIEILDSLAMKRKSSMIERVRKINLDL